MSVGTIRVPEAWLYCTSCALSNIYTRHDWCVNVGSSSNTLGTDLIQLAVPNVYLVS